MMTTVGSGRRGSRDDRGTAGRRRSAPDSGRRGCCAPTGSCTAGTAPAPDRRRSRRRTARSADPSCSRRIPAYSHFPYGSHFIASEKSIS